MKLAQFTAAVLLLSTSAQAEIRVGANTSTAMFDGARIAIETYRPDCPNPGILILHHGSGRSTYSSGSTLVANRECLVVVSPIYPEADFDSNAYQRGGIVDGIGSVLPRGQWTTRLEKLTIDWAVGQVGGKPDVYLFGFSAGGQFLSRVAAYERPGEIRRIVVGSPSTWVLPSLTEDAPYGFDGLGTEAEERSALQEYLALPITIYLGSADNDPNDPELSKNSAAMRQGRNRLERGQNTFAMGKQVAEANGWAFNWRLVIAPNVGHSGTEILKSPSTGAAFGFSERVANRAPQDIMLSGASLDETAAPGWVVGALDATDPDGDRVVFSVAGDARFTVNASNQLVVAGGATFPGSGDRAIPLTVTANDGNGGISTALFTIVVHDVITGTNASETLNGTASSETLLGLNGNDSLNGKGGNDTLRGGAGNDVLRGGDGADVLIGGPGNDILVVAAASESKPGARDEIRAGDGAIAFEGAGVPGGDLIELSGIDADTSVKGNQKFTFGPTARGGLSLVDLNGDTLVRGNTNGDAAFEFEILIKDGDVKASAYTAADFNL